MSLINDMLQDLDSRKQLANSDPASREDIATLQSMAAARPPIGWIFFGIILAALAGFLLARTLAASFWFPETDELVQSVPHKQEETEMDVSVNAVALLDVTDPAPITKNESAESGVEDTPTEVTVEVVEVTEIDNSRARIESLLAEAEVALNSNRLSLPRGQSAYHLYHQVIDMDAGNRQALSGLERIKTRYMELIDNALAATEFGRASQLVKRVESLSLQFPSSQLSNYRNRIQQQKLAAQSAKVELDEPASFATDNQNSAESYLAINKTTVSRELALAQEAQQLFAQGRGREAAAQLENFIAGNAKADLSRVLLFDYHLGQAQISHARKLMEPAYAMNAATLAYLQARLSMMSSGTATAIALLEKQQPEKNIAEIYNALLAGLYQKEKSHGKAVTLYASLIELNPSNVTYWLGMGVSRDALGEHQSAINAYNVVLAHKNLDDNVRNFVKTRIEALSSQELAEATW